MLTHERLLRLLSYDPDIGVFTNRVNRPRAYAGNHAGSPSGHGYRKISIDGQRYYEHHLAWFYTYGRWPVEIDHRDGNGENNALSNLRECDRTENCFNAVRSTGESGLKGAYLDRRSLQWYSKIQVGCQVIWLGAFNTPEEAHLAFMKAVEHHHGEFALHKRNPTMEP